MTTNPGKRKRVDDCNETNKRLSADQTMIDLVEQTIAIFKDYLKSFPRLQNTDPIDINCKLEREIFKFKHPTMTIACFGPPGSGKSSFINCLITGRATKSMLPVTKSIATGCTQKPIKCSFVDDEIFSLEYVESLESDISTLNEFTNLTDLSATLKGSMDNPAIKMIIIKLPKSIVENLDYKIIQEFEFIDLIGVPDKSNANSYNLNKNALKDGIDGLFLIKSQTDRGIAKSGDIHEMYKCDVFKSGTYNTQPKLVISVLINNSDESNIKKTNEILKYQLMQSVSDAFDFKLNESDEHKIKDLKISSEKIDDQLPALPISNKNFVLNDICDRVESLLLVRDPSDSNTHQHLTHESSKSLIKVFHDIKDHKLEILKNKCLQAALYLNKKLMIKIKSYLRGVEAKKNQNKFYSTLKEYLYGNSTFKSSCTRKLKRLKDMFGTQFYEYISDFKIHNISDPNDSRDILTFQLENNVDPFYSEIIKSFKIELVDLVDKIKHLAQNNKYKIDEFMHFNELDDNYFNKKLEFEKESIKFKKEIYRIMKDAYMKLIVGEITDNIKIKAQQEIIKLIEEFWTEKVIEDLKKDVFSEIEGSIYEAKINFIEKLLDNQHRIQHLLNDSKLKERKNDWYTELPKPNLFIHDKSFHQPKPGPIKTKLKECKDEKLICAFPKNDKKIEKTVSILRSEDLFIEHKEATNELIKETANYGVGYIAQIHIDYSKKRILAEYNRDILRKKINDLVEKVSVFEYNHIESNNYEHESEMLYKKMVLNPIFIYVDFNSDSGPANKSKKNTVDNEIDSDEDINGADTPSFIKNKSILLSKLCKSVNPENALLFLFIEAGPVGQRDESNIRNLHKMIEHERKELSIYELPIVTVFLDNHLKTRKEQEKLMILFAEHLNITRFYIVTDSIKRFHEFDSNFKEQKSNQDTVVRCLYFMSKVLINAINSDENDDELFKNKKKFFCLIQDFYKSALKTSNPCADQLEKLTDVLFSSEKELKEKKFYAKQLINDINNHIYPDPSNNLKQLNATEEEKKTFKEMRRIFSEPYSKVVGDISLINQADQNYYKLSGFKDRLLSRVFTTHCVFRQKTSQRDVVMYNLDALKGVHPLTKDEFFQKDQKHSDDDDYFHIKVLNRISSLVLYYFSFVKDKKI